MVSLAYLLLALCTAWIVFGFFALLRATRYNGAPRASNPAALPAVSVLKPLCGADSGLYDNLQSFFRQDYPHFELVFGVEDPEDPAIAIVQALKLRYPHVACSLVVHPGGRGRNPKVSNLRGMLPAASHELLLVSDSNVYAPPEYLRDMVSILTSGSGIGLVTNVFAGAGENTLGAALENVQLNGFCASGTTLPTLLGDSLVVGKSMLLRRSEFERIGGFERVANVLAEDFVIGKMYQHAGLAVRIAPTILTNTTSNMTVQAYLKRHLRWCMLRWHLRPFAYALEPITSPLFLLPVATFVLGYAGLLWVAGLLAIRDLGGWLLLRGPRRAWLPVLLSVVRELTMLCIWICAPLKRHVEWRGHRARLGAGTLLFESR